MALVFLLLIMVFARVILHVTDRGSVERAVFLHAHVADRLVELYETMAERFPEGEIPCECDAVMERLDPTARWRISLAYGARLALLAIFCQAIVTAGLAPAWALAVIPAASTFLLPALDAWLLARQGRTAPPAKTPKQRTVGIAADLVCGALAWIAFGICLGGRGDPCF